MTPGTLEDLLKSILETSKKRRVELDAAYDAETERHPPWEPLTEEQLSVLGRSPVISLTVDQWFASSERLTGPGVITDVSLATVPRFTREGWEWNPPRLVLAGNRWRCAWYHHDVMQLPDYVRMGTPSAAAHCRLVLALFAFRWPGITFHLPEEVP